MRGGIAARVRGRRGCGISPISHPIPTCENDELASCIKDFGHLFGDDNPCITGVTAHIDVDPAIPPVKMRARHVPLALCDAVDKELDAMIARGTYTPVRTARFASPVVIVGVGKPGGAVRDCADYSATVARAVNTDCGL